MRPGNRPGDETVESREPKPAADRLPNVSSRKSSRLRSGPTADPAAAKPTPTAPAAAGPTTGTATKRTVAQQRLSTQRAAAARERIAAAERRRRMWIVGSAVLTVLTVLAVLVVVKVATGAGGPRSGKGSTPVASRVIADVTSVPTATLDAIGAGTATSIPIAITAPALRTAGKPDVLYVGAEYCPYCAAERWAVAVALSRFGTLHGVGQTASSANDVYPSTPTLSFHDASLSSNYLAFTPKELQSNKVVNGRYATLDTLTAAQRAILAKYNASPYVSSNGAIPFIDIGGKYLISGASYDPAIIHGKTHEQIAAALSDPNSPAAKAIGGTANLITAAICKLTGGAPTNACSSVGVTTAAAKLNPKS